jgi:hypothetical protein
LGIRLVAAALMTVAAIPSVALAHHVSSPDFATTIPLAQTNPGIVTQSLSFVDANRDGLPDDLNGNGILEEGLAPAGDQLPRIDRVGQSFEGTIDEVTALTKKGDKVSKKLTGSGITINFNSTIFVGPEITPGVHAIFGAAGGNALIKQQEVNASLTIEYQATLQGMLNLGDVTNPNDDSVVVFDAGDWFATDAQGELNSVKYVHGNFSAQATGLVGAESAMVTLSGAAQ